MTKRNPKKSKPNLLKRWYVWKYSGLLTVFPTIGMILLVFFIYQSQLEFYDNFTCDGLVIYKISNRALGDNPTYNELSDESKERYDRILNECADPEYGLWYYDGKPILNAEHQNILRNEIVAYQESTDYIAEHGDFGE